jgi:hypothetical protein
MTSCGVRFRRPQPLPLQPGFFNTIGSALLADQPGCLLLITQFARRQLTPSGVTMNPRR